MERALLGDWEISGDVDLIGADVDIDDAAKQAAAAQILARNGILLKERVPTKARLFPIGFTSDGVIASLASAVIVSRPQVLFKGLRLVIPSDIAGDFTIDDLKVGKNSMFASESSLPARCMQEDAWGVYLHLDTAQISQDVSLAVTNISGADRTFRAMILGKVAET
jgi:hypothetical protein